MEEGRDFSLCGKSAVTEANLRDEYYWRLVADFIGPQSGEGLELEKGPCKNRLLIQVGLMIEDNNFPWIAIVEWLKKIFPNHQSTDFRRLIERGIATTLSLGSDARLTFLESYVNFNFVGPICDSIGVERHHLLEMTDFSERAQSIEVTNALILELSNFVSRERITPLFLVQWLRNFNPEFCKDGNIQKAYQVLRAKIKKLKLHYRNHETRSHRRNAMMENLLQSPFELVRKKEPKFIPKKRVKRDDLLNYEKVTIKEEYETYEIMQDVESDMNVGLVRKVIRREHVTHDENDEDTDDSNSEGETSHHKQEALTLLDIAMLSVQKLSRVYGGKTEACKQVCLDLLKNQYALTCKEHPAMAEFEKKLDSLCEDFSVVYPVVFLNHNANFLVDMHDAVEQQIMSFEKEIILSTGEKLGRDKLPKFNNFVNFSESATSRYIHMACDVLSHKNPDMQNYRKHWVAFCEEKNNPSRLEVNQSNRFNHYFEAAAGLIHHHKEMALFFSDLLSMTNDANIVLECVAADANDSVIQSLVCVLAIVYCKIIGPYWQLLKSGGEYSLFSQYLLCLYQKFLDWSKDPSTLLEPEGTTNVFLQFPLQEKTYEGVFQYCGHWHTNRNLIRACLKRIIKVIAGVTDEHLKDFLPGGSFAQVPPPELSSELVSCTFSVLMAEYPFSEGDPERKRKSEKSPKRSRKKMDSSQEDNDRYGSSDNSGDESYGWHSRKKSSQKDGHSPQFVRGYREREPKVEEEREEIMDRDYIIATVNRNGGPCRTQQDVDKLLLRFDGKPRTEKREALRCEILYQKMILNNTEPHLNEVFQNSTQMALKLKLALPRVKPGYSLVLAPKKTKSKAVTQYATYAATGQSEYNSTGGL
ncbi:solute carrier family 52, riboflavin transporter, member 2 [Plectropomus leopardus]|uniref:solute carrier family 52, riboflavin transporter, member 2 n=1 Tax=Plectropomus leopardus TaxID=160734 RepID=UPI001C4DA774|nr:solute carrier family 52, riboflavin transporter, member 2 [Plectropomus leopardus]